MKKCLSCGIDDLRVLKEEHHLFGKSIDGLKSWICSNCHLIITSDQNSLPPKIRACKEPYGQLIMLSMSIFSLLEVIGKSGKRLAREVVKHGRNSR